MIESNPEKSKLQILKMQIHESIMLMFENQNPDFIRKNQILASNIKLLEEGIIKEWEKENITIKMFNEFLNEVYRSLKKRYPNESESLMDLVRDKYIIVRNKEEIKFNRTFDEGLIEEIIKSMKLLYDSQYNLYMLDSKYKMDVLQAYELYEYRCKMIEIKEEILHHYNIDGRSIFKK